MKKKIAQCVEMHRDPDAVHITLELDPPCMFQDAETRRFRIIDTMEQGGRGRQIIADNGSWLHIQGTGSGLSLAEYLSRYYGYQEPLVSQLRRLRGRWDDLDRPPRHAPHEMRGIWATLDEVQRLLVALMSDRITEALNTQAAILRAEDPEE